VKRRFTDTDRGRALTIALLVGVVLIIFMLSGCTWAPQQHDNDATGHTSTMPAVQICFLAACDGIWADRTERAAGGLDASNANEGGDVKANQEATSTPTLNIPLDGSAGAGDVIDGVGR
jgi:hypothetical protein